MALTDLFTLANDVTFRQKLRIAVCKTALNVAGETPSNSFARDEKRNQLAVAILSDGAAAKLEAFAYAAASFGSLTAVSTDSDIEFVVSSIFNDLAGVSGRENL